MIRTLFSLLLASALLLSACGDNSQETPLADYTLTFTGTYDGERLEKYKDYPYDDYKVAFYRFNTYLSNVTLLKGNEEIRLADVEWVDFTPDISPTNTSLDVPLRYNVPEGDYTGIRIGFGVRPDLNAKQPRDFAVGHPLAREIEYWLGWRSYIFNKIEGQGDSDGDNQPDIFLIYHCGSDDVYREYTFQHPIRVEKGSGNTVELDLKKIFTINGQWFNLKEPYNQFTSNNPADVVVATILMDNFDKGVIIK